MANGEMDGDGGPEQLRPGELGGPSQLPHLPLREELGIATHQSVCAHAVGAKDENIIIRDATSPSSIITGALRSPAGEGGKGYYPGILA